MNVIETMLRQMRAVLVLAAGCLSTAGSQPAIAAEGPFLSAEMRLYFEGPPLASARSTQSIVLIYLPAPASQKSSYDHQHDAIEQAARRLSTDVQVVPLTDLAPVPGEHAHSWLRAADCHRRPSILPSEDDPALYFSFSGRSNRYCIGVSSSGTQSARLISTLRDLEETDCSYNREFIRKVLGWMEPRSDAQYDGASLLNFADLGEMLRNSARAVCDGW
ncbi:hypothetical protein WNZ15_24020 [Roseibium sp. AS2]|uniref:hypothetical protein n=1 Tax=Roseibium sp. AS2 TaxID=3135781 RepID=UPI00316D8A02